MTRALAAALLFGALALAACRDGGGGDPDVPDTLDVTPAAVETTPSDRVAACSPKKMMQAPTTTLTLDHDGIERAYILHVPPRYDGATPLPLVLNFHGFGSSAGQQSLYSQLHPKADAEGFIVVSPDGTGEPRRWNTIMSPDGADDVGFIGALLDTLQRDLCIDSSRVFAAGMSNGAAFAQRVACAMPGRIAAVAAVTALVYPGNCTADQPIPVIGFHGTADPCVPFEGGVSRCGAGLPVPPIEQSALNWAKHNGCNTAPSQTEFTASVRAIAYSECDGETAVVLYVIEGGGHTWPGAVDVPRLGTTTHEISATDLIWEFFVGQANLR